MAANNTYTENIPALAPLASGANDNPAAVIAQGDQLNQAHVIAANKQYENRTLLRSCIPPLATDHEVSDAKRRRRAVESSNFAGPTPLWAQALQQQMQGVQQQVQGLQQQLQRVEQQIRIESQRSRNFSRQTKSTPIQPLERANGQTPQGAGLWFPADAAELNGATGQQITPLLQFYGLQAGGTVPVRRGRLAEHLGIVL